MAAMYYDYQSIHTFNDDLYEILSAVLNNPTLLLE